MLHVDRGDDPLARWSVAGWPPRLEPSPIQQLLAAAAVELASAADAADTDAVDDLTVELEALLGHLLSAAAETRRATDATPEISLRLWGDLQHAVGRGDWVDVGLQATLLGRLAGPATQRPEQAVPPYRAPVDRVAGGTGHLPLIDTPDPFDSAADSDAGRAFLLGLAAALLVGQAHLVDPETAGPPAEAIHGRVGWPQGRIGPTGPRVGSLRPGGSTGFLVTLRSAAAVTAVNRTLSAAGRPPVEESTVAAALTAAWLMDTTLVVDAGGVRRRAAVHTSVLDGEAPEWLWQIPVAAWHPRQFYDTPPTPRPARRLRVLPPTR